MDFERILARPGPNPALWYCRECASVCVVLFGIATRCPQCGSTLAEVERRDARVLIVQLLGDPVLLNAWDALAEAAILGRLTAEQRDAVDAVLLVMRAASTSILTPREG